MMNILSSETNYFRRAQKDGSHSIKNGDTYVGIDTSAYNLNSLYYLNLCIWEREIFINGLGSRGQGLSITPLLSFSSFCRFCHPKDPVNWWSIYGTKLVFGIFFWQCLKVSWVFLKTGYQSKGYSAPLNKWLFGPTFTRSLQCTWN